MNFGYLPEAQVRVGQFKEPFSYEVLLPEKYLDFIERSIAATVISPAEDIGIMVHSLGAPIGRVFEYGVGMFNGLGATEKKDPNKTFEYVGRFAVYPFANSSSLLFRGARLAVYGLYEGHRPKGVDMQPRTPLGFEFLPRIPTQGRRTALGGDLQYILGPFSAKAEYIRNVEETPFGGNAVIQGWHTDATYVVTGENKIRAMQSGLEIAARIEQLWADAGSPTTVSGFTDSL